MNKIFISFLFILILGAVNAQSYTPTPENLEARKDFQDMKFGMFIHWGASSVFGHGEWVMNDRNIKVSDYKRLQDGKERLGKLHSFYESTIN